MYYVPQSLSLLEVLGQTQELLLVFVYTYINLYCSI